MRVDATATFDELEWCREYQAVGGLCMLRESGDVDFIIEVHGRSDVDLQRGRTLIDAVVKHPQSTMRLHQLAGLIDFLQAPA